MRVTKKQLWDEIFRLEKSNRWFHIGFYIILFILIGYVFFNQSNPTIKLHKGIVDTEPLPSGRMFETTGRYIPGVNHIDVSIADVDEAAAILFHEYGHFVYDVRMNSTDKAYWKGSLCNKNATLEGYGKVEICGELFARYFEDYLLHNRIKPKIAEFLGVVVDHYIDE